jgi:hypothetical protein
MSQERLNDILNEAEMHESQILTDEEVEELFEDDEDYSEDDDDEIVIDSPMKNIFIKPVPKKLKFTRKTIEKIKFGSVKGLLDVQNGAEAYLSAYSEMEFLTYMYNKVNGFYPDVLRMSSIRSEKFIENLFKFATPPLESYNKSYDDIRGDIRLNTMILAFNVDGKDDLFVYLDQSEISILYNKAYEKNTDSQLHTLIGLMKGCTQPKSSKNKIYVVYQNQRGFEKIGFNVKKVNVNLEENYNDGFADVSKEIVAGLNSKNKTNLVILSGPPGTGKTSFLRYLTSKIKKNIIFISPDLVGQITDPMFIPFLIKNNDTVLIIEDAEPALQARDGSGRTGAVSNVLNLTDGLLSDCLNISIIATFNTGGKDIDQALLRKGRLLKNYKFEKLAVNKSKALLKKLGHGEVEVKEAMSLADIYFYASDNNTQEFKRSTVGFK